MTNDPPVDPCTETVLIVEDESAVRELVSDILASAGYNVRTAGNGVEALALLARDVDPVHLVLSDVVMPEMSGPSLAVRLASVRPEIPVLFMSGYADEETFRHGLEAQPYPLLNKPFSVSELRRAVRAVLDGRDGARP